MARPVIGGSFAFLALERACDGRAVEGLSFLDDDKSTNDDSEGKGERGDGEL